jgi:hypothetical protein
MIGFALIATACRRSPEYNQPPIHWISESKYLALKRPGREAYHSLSCSDEVKMLGAIPPLPKYIFMAWY